MKPNVEKIMERVVDNMTRGRCIPTDSMKSRDDCSNLGHNFENWDYIESNKTNLVHLVGSY